MWRSAKDDRGRTYYYHVKLRQPQWTPPPPPLDEAGMYAIAPSARPARGRPPSDTRSSAEDSSSEEEQPQRAPRPLRAQGRLVEGVHGVYEGT